MGAEIGEILRSRRARVGPADAGLPVHGRRRVPGLRREELARLAGVSVDYYVRLEQGRASAVSDAVLDAIARVLRLDETERAHLRDLARPSRKRTRRSRHGVRAGVRQLLEAMAATPAFVLDHRLDVLAWNALGDAVYGFAALPQAERNAARHTFLHGKDFYRDWDSVAAETVAVLRRNAGAHPDDGRMAALVGELAVKSEEFRALWAKHPVLDRTYGTKRLRHEVVGDLDLSFETLMLADHQTIAVYTAPQGSPAEERLWLLASWAAPATDAQPG